MAAERAGADLRRGVFDPTCGHLFKLCGQQQSGQAFTPPVPPVGYLVFPVSNSACNRGRIATMDPNVA